MYVNIDKPECLLKLKLITHKMTVKQCANKLNIPYRSMLDYIAGVSIPCAEFQFWISSELGVPADVWSGCVSKDLNQQEAFYYVFLRKKITPKDIGISNNNIIAYVRGKSKGGKRMRSISNYLLREEGLL